MAIATFPLRNRHPTGVYEYYMCDESFSDDEGERGKWTEVVNDALGRWVSATNGLVQMDQQPPVDAPAESGICYDFRDPDTETYIVDEIIESFNQMVPENRVTIEDHVENVLDTMHNLGIRQREESMANEIWMVDDTRGSAIDANFKEVSRLVARDTCPSACVTMTAILEDGSITVYPDANFLFLEELEEPNVKVTSDILVMKSKYGSVYEEDKLNILPSAVRFDKCKGEEGYNAYRAVVHEAGHALGVGIRSAYVTDKPAIDIMESHPSLNLFDTIMGAHACTPFPLAGC